MKVVVIDDDPTGSQTVHSCPLLLRWDVDTLRRGLRHASPLLFLLADTRALTPTVAAERNRGIAAALDLALQREGLGRDQVLLVSRGDSTLRGHGVLEPEVLQGAFGPFDATFHVPAFLEGGRTTVNGVHLLHGEPVHTTPFAQDRLFGFSSSDLARWLEEKSDGAIAAASVLRISGRLDLAMGGPGIEQFTKSKGQQATPKLDYGTFDWNSVDAGRRSIYRVVWRGIPDPFMEAMDFPDLGLLAPKRGFSVSGLQSLAMFNNDFVLHASEWIALRLQNERERTEAQVKRAFELAWLETPTARELEEYSLYAEKFGLAAFCRLLLNSNEFLFVD